MHPNNPLDIFKNNWQRAKDCNDANAPYCFLATCNAEQHSAVRILVLRKVTDDGFVIYINRCSPKWQDLCDSPNCELLVFWPTLMQQYRIRGDLALIPAEEMAKHWQHKPYEAKLLDHQYLAGPTQSSVISGHEELLNGIKTLKHRYPEESEIPYPDNAIGLKIKPTFIEVWQGSPNDGLHERAAYRWCDNSWTAETLMP